MVGGDVPAAGIRTGPVNRRAGVALAVAALVAAGVAWALASVVRVAEDEYVVRAGHLIPADPAVLGPGTRFVPFGLFRAVRYPAGVLEADLTADGVEWITVEGASLSFRARVRYRVAIGGIERLHRAVDGDSIEDGAIVPAMQAALDRVARDPNRSEIGSGAFREAVERGLAAGLDGYGIELIGLDDVQDRPGDAVVRTPRVADRNVLVVGLDGADWDLIDPLIGRGELPNLARLVEGGVRARLRTIHPILSPVVWTTVATGKRPEKHGIFDFLAEGPDGTPVPVTRTLWTARPVWDLLGDAGVPVAVTAWWATWPAEPVRGYMATDRIAYQLFRDVIPDESDDPAAEARGKAFPPALYDDIRPRIVPPAGVRLDDLGSYLDLDVVRAESLEDAERVDELKTVAASGRTYEAVATMLLDRQPRGFHAVYHEGTDTVAHLFMTFRSPAMDGADPARTRAFAAAVDGAYREADAMLGRLLDRVDDDWIVVVLSDHGFKHGDNRPATDPRISHGPAADWHDRFGVLVMHGPDIRRGAVVADASVLDVAPTLLALYGLPVGDDMDGRVLEDALEPGFLARNPVERVPTWERAMAAPRTMETIAQDADLMEKLRSLGYIGGTEDPASAAGTPGEVRQQGARALNNRGVALLAQGDRDAALRTFQEALDAGGGVPSLNNIARVHLSAGRPDDAAAALDAIEAADPGFRQLAELRGWEHDLRGDAASAERWLREAVRTDPSDSRSLTRLGHLLEAKGDLSGAEARYGEAVRADPENALALNYLGNVQRLTGRRGQAEASYRASIDADPRYPGAYNNLGILLQEDGRLAEARTVLQGGLQQAPESAMLHTSMAGLEVRSGDLDAGERHAHLALEADPGLAEAHNVLGIALAERGRMGEARSAFEAAVEADPDYAEATFNLARVVLLGGDVSGAMIAFGRASDLDPGHLDAALGAGETAYRLGRDAFAIRYYERARSLADRIPRIPGTLGILYERTGDTTRAAERYRECLALDPDRTEIRARLDALLGAGDG